jgi:hypothetical protein
MFFTDFGRETLRSDFSGRRESLRLFSATPPAIPASAAPPAIKGVLAFDASSATFPPALPIAPLELLARALDVERARELDDLAELLRDFVPERLFRPLVLLARELVLFDLLDEPFRLVDLLELERRGLDRLLEDRVVWAMVIASLLASVPAAPFRTGGPTGLTR